MNFSSSSAGDSAANPAAKQQPFFLYVAHVAPHWPLHAREADIAVWACLHDGALPGWFSVDEHGFGDARSRGYFWSRHVELVGEAFGDLVHGWVPVFEPRLPSGFTFRAP